MYTVFQPFLIHLFYLFIYVIYFCPVQHQNRDRDCTFGLVSNMSTHHKQNISFRSNTFSFLNGICLRSSNTVAMVCKPTDCICPHIVLNGADLGHRGYIDGECVVIKAGGACAILGVGSLILRLQDNDRS